VEGNSPLEPVIVHEARFPLPSLSAETDVIQQVVAPPPGCRAEATTNGFVAGMVLEGVATYTIGAMRREYKPGEAWSAEAGARILEENRSGENVRVFRTSIGPRGILPEEQCGQ
jgi:hypothetical protein